MKAVCFVIWVICSYTFFFILSLILTFSFQHFHFEIFSFYYWDQLKAINLKIKITFIFLFQTFYIFLNVYENNMEKNEYSFPRNSRNTVIEIFNTNWNVMKSRGKSWKAFFSLAVSQERKGILAKFEVSTALPPAAKHLRKLLYQTNTVIGAVRNQTFSSRDFRLFKFALKIRVKCSLKKPIYYFSHNDQ